MLNVQTHFALDRISFLSSDKALSQSGQGHLVGAWLILGKCTIQVLSITDHHGIINVSLLSDNQYIK